MLIFVNGERRNVAPVTRLLDVVNGSGPEAPGPEAPALRGIAVALDGTVVPKAELAQTELHEGARVEIVTAVQGG